MYESLVKMIFNPIYKDIILINHTMSKPTRTQALIAEYSQMCDKYHKMCGEYRTLISDYKSTIEILEQEVTLLENEKDIMEIENRILKDRLSQHEPGNADIQ